MKKNIDVSVIIVHYGHGGEVYKCLDSLKEIKEKFSSVEFILVDNNEKKLEETEIKKKYPWVKYMPTPKNLGWGGGRNFGFKRAKGIYILSLDSDIVIDYKSFNNIYKILKKNRKIGVVSTRIKDSLGKYTPGATLEMTPLIGIFYLSFINKYFPKSFVIRNFLMSQWDRKKSRVVDVVQLAAFMIKKSAYEEIDGFDEDLFLYFEENDVSKSLKEKGWKLFFDSKSEVIHLDSKGTPKETAKIKEIYAKSRFLYFKKHYGLFQALLVESFSRISKYTLILFGILLLSTILRFYRFLPNMMLGGEMGTDYMNVWNIIHGTRTFLIGPRTSHEWFFISPIAYWVYVLLLFIWNYNPVVINIFWGIIGSLSILVCYFTVKKIFNKNIALISSFLLATSPPWIIQTRSSRYNLVVAILFFPYLLYLRDSIKDKGKSLFKLGLVLGLTMSFFPSPILLIPAIIVSFVFYRVVPKFKYILSFILGFLIPNITFLIYEVSNKFAMTTQILSWIPYRVLGFFGLYKKNTVDSTILFENFYSIYHFFAESLTGYEGILSVIIFIFIVIASIVLIRRFYKKRNKEMPFFILIISLLVSYIGLFIHGNPPEHYYLVIFPVPAILAAYILDKLAKKKIILIGSTLLLGIIGIFGLTKMNWFYQDKLPVNYQIRPVPYELQLKIINSIIRDAKGAEYSLFRRGPEDQFENNFANNYIYLLTVRGAKIINNARTQYSIIEGNKNLIDQKGKLIFSEAETYVYKTQS